jgi:RNA polymerase sigma factor (sigma-70 family)
MADDTSFRVLMDELVGGRESAAADIVAEYTAALVSVARRAISPKLARRIDPEDVVQSAYRSFFVRMGRGEYELGNGKELWKLLLTITLNKVRKQGKFHRAKKRSVSLEQSAGGSTMAAPAAELKRSKEPNPEDAAILIEEVVALLATLRDDDRAIIELRLQGYNSVEIAKETGRAERTVRRAIERVERRLREKGQAAD